MLLDLTAPKPYPWQMRFLIPLLLVLSTHIVSHRTAGASSLTLQLADAQPHYDVVIAGAGTGGTMAAVQAARLGASVLLTEETDWIGGQMAAAAVTSMDEGGVGSPFGEGRPGVRDRGLYREFSQRAYAHYTKLGLSVETCYITPDRLATEPRVAQAILYDMLEDAALSSTIHVALCTSATAVLREGMKVTGVELAQDLGSIATRHINCAVLVDATELGDLLPLTGARYRVGNLVRSGKWEPPDSTTSSPANPPVQDATWTAVIRGHLGKEMPEPFMRSAPPEYDRDFFARALNNPLPRESTRPWSWERFIAYRGMPDSTNPDKTIRNPWARVTRTHMNISANDVDMTVRDIEEPARRLSKQRELKLRTLQLLYYVQNDMTQPVTSWTVATDEGYDTPFNRRQNEQLARAFPELRPFTPILDHFPVHAYMRESRRIVGIQTLRARDIDRQAGPRIFPHSVAVADYPADLHGGRRPEDLEPGLDTREDLNAIGFTSDRMGAFTIPYEVFVPETLDGFLAAEKNISQSRITNGATRLQPSTMLMGQAVGAIAALSVRHGLQPRHLRPAVVQAALLDADDILFVARGEAHRFDGVEPRTELWKAVQLCLLYGVLEPGEGTGGVRGWKHVSSGTQKWQGGEHGILTLAGGLSAAVLERNADGSPIAPLADGTVSADFTAARAAVQIGVIGRYRDARNFCSARIYRNNLELLEWNNGKVATLATVPLPAIPEGRKVRLTATFNQRNFSALFSSENTHTSASTELMQPTAGLFGLRAHAAATPLVIDQFVISDPHGKQLARHTGGRSMRITSDPLTRGYLAVLLSRHFALIDKSHQPEQVCVDVPSTHPAFAAVHALANADALLVTTSSRGLEYRPEQPVTRSELVAALAKILRVSQPSELAPQFFRATDDENLLIADYALLFREMLTSQPPDVRTTPGNANLLIGKTLGRERK